MTGPPCSALGHRCPRPVVRAAEENGEPLAALTLTEQTYEQAVHVQRYAAEQLRRFGKGRGYDLAESLVAAGQLSRGMSVLQQWRIRNADGTLTELWRMVAVTANNRALARLDVFGLRRRRLRQLPGRRLGRLRRDQRGHSRHSRCLRGRGYPGRRIQPGILPVRPPGRAQRRDRRQQRQLLSGLLLHGRGRL
ncbi:hypothetical protein ACIQI7_22070 [Kitasatospora sp. NPDC092039]|uniref:hypothetical protein n=1 Tax=Kitasatospora sp. NPDC092039 TaxID=3364086 RepID=UPI003807E056